MLILNTFCSTLVSAAIRSFWQRCTIFWKMTVCLYSRLLVSVLAGSMRISSGKWFCRQMYFEVVFLMSSRGLFMNKYIFPGADASCSLGWVINKVCHLIPLLQKVGCLFCSKNSWKVLVLRSRTLTFLVFTTPLQSTAGTRTG